MGNRLFVSIDLDGLADEVAAVQETLEGIPGLDLTDPAQAHVTLKFLGDTEPGRVGDVVRELERAVDDAGVDPFRARFGGLGVFPSLKYITVVWLGVREGGREMARLHEAIEPRLVGLGFESEDHEFTPHVTLARMDHAGGKDRVQEFVRERDPDAGELNVTEVRLTGSELTPEGPEYSTVGRIPL